MWWYFRRHPYFFCIITVNMPLIVLELDLNLDPNISWFMIPSCVGVRLVIFVKGPLYFETAVSGRTQERKKTLQHQSSWTKYFPNVNTNKNILKLQNWNISFWFNPKAMVVCPAVYLTTSVEIVVDNSHHRQGWPSIAVRKSCSVEQSIELGLHTWFLSDFWNMRSENKSRYIERKQPT